MTTNTETILADIMRVADPSPDPARQSLSLAHLTVRDRIMRDEPREHRGPLRRMSSVGRRAAVIGRRWTAPVTAIGATAAIVAAAAAAVSLSTVPTLVAGTTDSLTATPNPSAATGDLAEAWAFARERATSDFELDVLADGQVTLDEYRHAQRLFIECVEGAGLTVTVTGSLSNGTAGYEVSSARGDDTTNEIVTECGTGTIDVIEGLYMAITGYASELDSDG